SRAVNRRVTAAASNAFWAASSSAFAALARASYAASGGSLLDLVLAEAASVLGHDSPEAVAPDALFPQLGFDSLGAVELRNRIVAATGVPLLSTLIYDFPSPKALAGHLREECPDWPNVGHPPNVNGNGDSNGDRDNGDRNTGREGNDGMREVGHEH
ncbi:acyl carrier protein, partial [Streptomyces sp. NPDC005900]|uniref:acyl carrier protein n=1 Tax=Streptomyces sp. NPDC005900 TaxID=3154569 RepID=UPI0033EB02E0